MKVELFPFQKMALFQLRRKTAEALGSYQRTHTSQVLSFTAPTGAGKTIILASLIESIYFGDEEYPDQPDAIFVWLSDSPELNEQSRNKIDLNSILGVSENQIEENDHISVAINDYDFWFTPTHIAEIIELLKLKKKATEERKAPPQPVSKPKTEPVAKVPEPTTAVSVQPVKEEPRMYTVEQDEEELQSDTSAYDELIGRRVFHKSKKAYAQVVGCDGEYVVLNFESGDKVGQDVKYNLTMCLNNGWIEVVD